MTGKRWLDAVIEAFAVHPIANSPHPGIAKALKLLLSDAPDATSIRAFLQERNPKEAHPWQGKFRPIGYAGPMPLACDYWEADVFWLAQIFESEPGLSTWDLTDRERRFQHARTVARYARGLADALEDEASPGYPPLLALLGESDALALAEHMPEILPFVAWRDWPPAPPPLDSAAGRLSFQLECYVSPQLPAVLRRLADYADASVRSKTPVTRYQTGDPSARAFACKLSELLTERFGGPCDRIAADCVALKYPELERPTEEAIRKWTGRK